MICLNSLFTLFVFFLSCLSYNIGKLIAIGFSDMTEIVTEIQKSVMSVI